MPPTVLITRRGAERVRAGHPWIYRSDVVDRQAAAGDTVRVIGPRGRILGYALYSDRSEITLRLVTLGDAPAGLEVWRDRLARASAYRRTLGIDATACRLVHGEADLLPSLVVDRYGEYLVVQTLSQGTDRLLPDLVRLLTDLERPAGILARNDPKVRLLEGLEQRVELLAGDVPASVVSGKALSRSRSISAPGRRPASSSTSARTARSRRVTRAGRRSTPSAIREALPWRWPAAALRSRRSKCRRTRSGAFARTRRATRS